MAVTLEQARKWEMAGSPRNRYAEILAVERTKDWATRLAEYWAWKANERKGDRAQEDPEDFRLTYRSGNPEFHGFMHLPREIRDMIYEYRLVKGTVFMPNSDSDYGIKYDIGCAVDRRGRLRRRYEGLPSDWGSLYGQRIGLICGVSTTVQVEATAIFYGRNRFVFPFGPIQFPMYYEDASVPPYCSQLRDISHAFDMRDECGSDYDYRIQISRQGNILPQLLTHVNTGNARERGLDVYMHRLHEVKLESVLNGWHERVQEMKGWMLDRVQISLEECYCAMGCCRLAGYVIESLVDPGIVGCSWEIRPPKVIEVLGWYDEKEKNAIEKELEKLSTPDTPVDVRFVGKSITEDGTE